MSFQLRREELLSSEQLQSMLAENPARAAQAILMAAKQGILEGQALLGQILLEGQGIERDVPLAFRWFTIAANGGHLMARNMLGRCLEHGWGCELDERAAASHYRLAAQGGLDWGLYNYANLLATGRGVAQDQYSAFALYREAAHLGHAKSMNLLGRYLEDGRYCPADPQAARQWYERSAHAGDFRGQFSHAAVLAERGDVEGALVWLERAQAIGNLKFLRVSRTALLEAKEPAIRAMGEVYQARINALINKEV